MKTLASLVALLVYVTLVSAQSAEFGQCKFIVTMVVSQLISQISGGGIGWTGATVRTFSAYMKYEAKKRYIDLCSRNHMRGAEPVLFPMSSCRYFTYLDTFNLMAHVCCRAPLQSLQFPAPPRPLPPAVDYPPAHLLHSLTP